ncbi:MAG: NADAR family protein [Hyphomicrobiales bacterium]
MQVKYTIEKIIENKEIQEFLFFWGHTEKEKGIAGKHYLSQWWPSAFVVDNIEYKTAEHWMMARKAHLFGDMKMFNEITQCEDPKNVKALGRKIKGFEEELWVKHRYEIVKEGNFHKFNQSEKLRNFLLSTDDKVLVEASPFDKIWGIGMSVNDSNIISPDKWRGLNLLGFALMEVRDQL